MLGFMATFGKLKTQEESMRSIDLNLRRLMYWLAVMSLLALLSSCSSKPEDAITGKWQEINGTETTEFLKNGTMNTVDKGTSLAGNFAFVDKEHIKITMGGAGAAAGPIVAKVAVSNGELDLTMPDGKVLKYKKAQ